MKRFSGVPVVVAAASFADAESHHRAEPQPAALQATTSEPDNMKTLTAPIEPVARFEPFVRATKSDSDAPSPWLPHQLLQPRHKHPLLAPLKKSVSSVNSTDSSRHEDNPRDRRSGPPTARVAVREWGLLIPPESAFASPPVADSISQAGSEAASGRRILVADDDVLVRGSLAAVLESEGYTVDEAADGHEAVRRAVAHAPDLVLLDLNMPGWDGWTAFSQLERVNPLVPVIVITARPNQYDKAVKLGVDAFMEKPLNIHILLRAIRHLTSEDANRHVRRITDRGFVTKLLGGTQRNA